MTSEARQAGKEDVWTEQEYFAACLENKKRRLGLRSGIPQDEEEAAGALPEMSDYTMEVDKWYIHSDNPKLIGALTGRYDAEERIRAKEAVFANSFQERWKLKIWFWIFAALIMGGS